MDFKARHSGALFFWILSASSSETLGEGRIHCLRPAYSLTVRVPDRLAELRRQRQLMQEHLAWLDREIAAAGSPPADPAPIAEPAANPAISQPAPTPASGPDEADALLRQYTASPESLQKDVRKGCFLYFALASLAVIALVAVLYFALSKR